MDLSSGSAKGEFDYLPYLTIRMPFFSRHENGCDKTTSLSLLLFTFCHLNQLGIIVLVQLQIYLPTYLLPSLRRNCPPNPPSSSPLSSPRLASSSSTTILFFFFTHKKNSRQVRCTSAPSFLFKWVPMLDWSHWTKLDKAERPWRLQPAVQLIYKVPTVCM